MMSRMATRIATSSIGRWQRTWAERHHAAAVEAVRTAIARGDVYQVNLVQHLSAPFSGSPRALAARLAPLTQPNDAPLGDSAWRLFEGNGWAIVSASPELFLARQRGRAPDAADQGDPAPRRPRGAPRLGQGRRRARHDRRPRAQRPLARLRPRHGPLAGADGRRAAGRRRAPRLDRRGRRAARRRSRGDPRRALPGRLGDGGAEDRGRRPHRGARAGRDVGRRWGRSAASTETATSSLR